MRPSVAPSAAWPRLASFATALTLGCATLAAPLTSFAADPTPAPAPKLPEGTRIADKVVAIVNTDLVTLFELRRAAAPQAAKAVRDAKGDEKTLERALNKVVHDTLDALVDDILIAGEAKHMDLTVAPEKVDAHIKKIMDANDWTEEELAEQVQKLGFSSVSDYRRHTEREMLKSQVVSIKVASRVKVEESQVEQALRDQMSAGGKVEERRAAHILIRLDELATDAAVEEAKQKLIAAREKIVAGKASFAAMAKELSDDTNKGSGGDLGWFVKGDFDPAFEKVAFALKKGEVSQPFRTSFGLHIVVIEDMREKALASSADVETLKRQIRFQLREQELERLYLQWVKSLRADAFVQVKDLGLGMPAGAPEGDVDDAPSDEELPPADDGESDGEAPIE